MQLTAIKRHETLIDFAAQHAGNAAAVLSIAVNNGKSITDDIAPGTLLQYEVMSALPSNYYTPAVIVTQLKQRIKRFQTLLDYAAQFAGSSDAFVDVAKRNGYSITDDVTPGTMLLYDETNKNVAAYFRKKTFDIITGDFTAPVIEDFHGVGYDIIQDDQIVYP